MDGESARETDDQCAGQRAADRTHAADRDDGKGSHDHLDADAGGKRHARRRDRAAKRAQHRADQKGDDIDLGDVDAERCRRFAVVEHRDQHAAEPRLVDAVPGADRKQRPPARPASGRRPPPGSGPIVTTPHRPVGLRDEQSLRAPDQQQQIFQDQEGRIGHERGEDLVLVVEVLQQQRVRGRSRSRRPTASAASGHEQKPARERPAAIEIDARSRSPPNRRRRRRGRHAPRSAPASRRRSA